jgi:hypothetical protein
VDPLQVLAAGAPMKQPQSGPIKWPKTRSIARMKKMDRKALLRYARDLHDAHAENYRRKMEWDVFWAEFYRQLLKR